jgi:hypothetical protein
LLDNVLNFVVQIVHHLLGFSGCSLVFNIWTICKMISFGCFPFIFYIKA